MKPCDQCGKHGPFNVTGLVEGKLRLECDDCGNVTLFEGVDLKPCGNEHCLSWIPVEESLCPVCAAGARRKSANIS